MGEQDAAGAEPRDNAEALAMQLEQALAGLRQARAEECEQEIRAVLKRHGCRFETRQTIIDGKPGPVGVFVVTE